MVGFIFGIIFIIAGVVTGICFTNYKTTGTHEELAMDENGNQQYNSYGRPLTKEVTSTYKPLKKFSVLSFLAGAVLGVLLIFFGCIGSVSTGNTGVVTTLGRVKDYTYEAGFYFKAPWDSVTEMDNRVQKSTIELSCFSADIQEMSMKYTLNYQIDKENAQNIYKTIGKDYYSTIIEPNIAECVKVATAQYTAEQLVQTRSELATSIEQLLENTLANYSIKVSSTAIEDMDFTDSFTNAVEAKQVAEQKKKQAIIEQEQALLQAENDKKIAEQKASAEAEVAKIKAAADAEVSRIQAEAEAKVVEIQATAAEFQGKKDAAIAMNKLAGINGWYVVNITNETGEAIGYKLMKSNDELVSEEELSKGVDKLLEVYKYDKWDGKLPVYQMASDGTIVVAP